MSDTVKLIIEIPKDYYEIIKHNVENHLTDYRPFEIIGNGIPLDDVKAEIEALPKTYPFINHIDTYVKEDDVLQILDNIGKADKSCNTCKNSDDEFSGECYECVKNIQNHYEVESEVTPNDRT